MTVYCVVTWVRAGGADDEVGQQEGGSRLLGDVAVGGGGERSEKERKARSADRVTALDTRSPRVVSTREYSA